MWCNLLRRTDTAAASTIYRRVVPSSSLLPLRAQSIHSSFTTSLPSSFSSSFPSSLSPSPPATQTRTMASAASASIPASAACAKYSLSSPLSASELRLANDFVSFLSEATLSPYHAVRAFTHMLDKEGFTRLNERDMAQWASQLRPGGRYYCTRGAISVIAFSVPPSYVPLAGDGFLIFGAHTDSPLFQLKPISSVKGNPGGCIQIGTQTYGGGLWHTWFDRDLSIAGRVIIEEGAGERAGAGKGAGGKGKQEGKEGNDGYGSYSSRLLSIPRPLLRIPSLAIHLNREVTEKGFCPNRETNTVPILATAFKQQIEEEMNRKEGGGGGGGKEGKEGKEEEKEKDKDSSKHPPLLLRLLSSELNVPPSSIRSFDLSLFDTQRPSLSGAYNEFVVSRALDNLCMSYLSMRALVEGTGKETEKEGGKEGEKEANNAWQSAKQIHVCALFDHEEVGSDSATGAGSTFLQNTLQTLTYASFGANTSASSSSSSPSFSPSLYHSALRRSFLVSADMAHALHPNYPSAHENAHRPLFHQGLVIKTNANQRYATNGSSAFVIEEIARKHRIPVQDYCVKNDVMCGSTIGPIVSTQLGIRTVDVGIPQYSMHSIREMCATKDLEHALRLLKAIHRDFHSLDSQLHIQGEQ